MRKYIEYVLSKQLLEEAISGLKTFGGTAVSDTIDKLETVLKNPISGEDQTWESIVDVDSV